MTVHDELESALRLVLREQRPSGPASRELREKIDAIPTALRHEWLVIRVLREHLVPVAAAGVAVAAIAAAVLGFSRVPVSGLPPGAIGAPGAIGFDPSIEGVGLLTNVVRSLSILGTGIAIVAAIVALRELLSPRIATSRGRALVLAAVTVAALASGIVRLNGYAFLDRGGSSAVLLGAGIEVPAAPFTQGQVVYVTAAPGEPIVTMVSLRNDSPVPVRIEGVVVPDSYDQLDVARWTGLWLGGSSSAIGHLETLRPFEPTTIDPDQELDLYIVGKAGGCAFGPEFDPATWETNAGIAGMSSMGPDLDVAYSVFGLTSTVTIATGYTFAEPQRNGCSTSEAFGGQELTT